MPAHPTTDLRSSDHGVVLAPRRCLAKANRPGWLSSSHLLQYRRTVPISCCPLLLGRDGWMCFHSRCHQTLRQEPDGRVFGELPPCDDTPWGAAAYTRNGETLDIAYPQRWCPSTTPQTLSLWTWFAWWIPCTHCPWHVWYAPTLLWLGTSGTLRFLGQKINPAIVVPGAWTWWYLEYRLFASPPLPLWVIGHPWRP